MIISKWFKQEEFACKCGCGYNRIIGELLRVLEDVRETFNSPVSVNSGCRCERYNKEVGGEEGSKHLFGMAADIVVKGKTSKEIYDYLNNKYSDKFGIGLYSTWVHIDVRQDKARWKR